eukprot:13036469-Alexandrium_andersonii.AAC.1
MCIRDRTRTVRLPGGDQWDGAQLGKPCRELGSDVEADGEWPGGWPCEWQVGHEFAVVVNGQCVTQK